LTEIIGFVCVAVIAALPFATIPDQETSLFAVSELPADGLRACTMDRDGTLQGTLFGDLSQTIDWTGKDLLCDGMTRPDGVLLVFARRTTGQTGGLMLMIGIRQLKPGQTGVDLPANVTLINESSGIFYNAQGRERCWVSISGQRAIPYARGKAYRIDGELYCAGSLPAVNGGGSVTLDDVRFSGRLSLDSR